MAADSERHSRNIEALADAGLNAVVCGSATAVLLFSGYWPVMAASVVVFTAEGELTIILPEDELELASHTSAAYLSPYEPADLHTLQSPLERLRDQLRTVLEGLQAPDMRIGIQLGEGMQPASYPVGTQFHSALPNLLQVPLPKAELVPCGEVIQSLRPVKTSAELKLMQLGCDIAAAGFARAEACIRPGLCEADIAAEVQSAFESCPLAAGLERSYGFFFCMSGPNSAKAAGAYTAWYFKQMLDAEAVTVLQADSTRCGGYPTQRSANPGLTIQALAARMADYLILQGDRIFTSNDRDMTTPPIQRELAPPETWGKGVPRLK